MAEKLETILRGQSRLSEAQLRRAHELERESGRPFSEVLIEQKMVTAEELGEASCSHRGIRTINLQDVEVAAELVALLPEKVTRRACALPVRGTDGTLWLAMADPLDVMARDDVEKLCDRHMTPVRARRAQLVDAIESQYRTAEELQSLVDQVHADDHLDVPP